MGATSWLIIIAHVFLLLAEGMSKSDAVSKASERFGVSKSEIFSRL
ncbi:hypothetical protein GH741_01065 [Aquibacillus halophilus]|uniref:HTH psq-type domain-containing protein n=1 Tax=Aquibacillus halophilus TaxID=930132 RepID=A0A6A8D7K7_9BACI|nr:hypothetical protein [Aquibacillus halophilus]MRH41260.1 hypothetical protein [Aquibacillus halophilus]